MVFKKCCFCIDIRKGCLVVATSGILITLLSLIVLILANIFDWSFYFKVAGCIIHLGGYGCLLYGARNENRSAITVFLSIEAVNLVYDLMKIIISLEILGRWIKSQRYSYDEGFNLVIGWVVGNVLVFLITIYFWICAFSYFKYLRNIGADSTDEFQEMQELKSIT